jgi:O-antigen ligase
MPSKAILGLALIGASLVAMLAIGDMLWSGPFEALMGGLLGDSGLARASGTFVDPNYLGLYMAPATVFAMALVAIARRPRKIFLVLITLLLFACLLLTYSRGAYVGAFAGLVVFVGMRSRPAALILLVVGIVAMLTLYPAFQEARLGETLSIDSRLDQAASDNSRRAIMVAAVAMFASSPLFGVGYGAFQFLSPLYSGSAATYATYSHNQYLSILAEQGIVGLAMVAGIIVLTALALKRSRSPLRQAALAMGTAYLVTAFFLHSATAFQSSCLVWLVMAAALVPYPRRTDHILEA